MRFGGLWAGLFLLGLGAPAHAAWQEVRTPHFLIYSEGSPDFIRRFANNLERFDQSLRKIFQFADPAGDDPNPLTIFMVDSVEQVNSLCRGGHDKANRAEADAACRYVAGFYDGRASGSVAFVPRAVWDGSIGARTILFHEYAHHMMLANSQAAYPAWYVEGFAEFISNVKLDKPGEVGVGLPANDRYGSLIGGRRIPVRELLTTRAASLNSEDSVTFYARSWLLTHYLTFSLPRNGQITKYLAAINQGKSSADAASMAFGDLDALNKELEAYLTRGKFSYRPVPVTDLPAAAIRIRRLERGEAAMMPIRLQSQRAVTEQSAPLLAGQARHIAAAWPSDPGAQLILAEAEYDAGYDDEAEAAADRVLAVQPDNRKAMIFKALAIMHRAKEANQFADAIWKAARGWLLKANKAEPDAAWPLVLFYRSFLEQGKSPTANAIAALEQGAGLAPQDDQVRMMLVRQYLRERKVAQARAMLVPLAFDPHAAEDNPARRLLERLDKNGLAALSGPNIDISIEDPEPDNGK
jgi:tetratricopeptide (TPR) repeat protein